MVSMRGVVWTAANVVMLLMFLMSLVVQYNDPDPVRWMLIYGAAALIAGLEIRRSAPVAAATAVGAAAFVWMITISRRVLGHVGFAEMFSAWEMKNVAVEEEREMYGLLLVALWMAAVAVAVWRRRSAGSRA